MPDTATLLTREFTVRAEAEGDAREVVGLAVPYGQIIERYDPEFGTSYERFEAGSVEAHPDGHMYFYGHAEPIGTVLEGRDTPEGYEVRARISATSRGEDVYTLLKDGVLTKHSIGFYPVEARVDKVALADGGAEVDVLTRTKVLARETSVVPFPAYDKAGVTEVRDRETDTREKDNMPDTLTRDDLKDLEGRLTDLDRRLAVGLDGLDGRDSGPALDYRSAGEFLKALSSGEARDHVEALNRAYEGAATGDVTPGVAPAWIDRDVKLVDLLRPIVGLFNRDSLPAEGMAITYPTFDSAEGAVGRQANEGDALNLLKLKIKNATADVTTEGGAAELTKQVIDRMPAAYLSKVLQMLTISYAKNTNSIVRARLLGATGTNATVDISATATDPTAYIGAMIDAAGLIEDNSLGLALDFVLANRADFKQVATLKDKQDRPVFGVSGGGQAVNAIGSLDVKAQVLDVGGVPWVLDPGMAANALPRACSAQALTVLESPGAPFALHDENIINLTEAFSRYGYIATTVDDAKGIVPVKVRA